MDIDAEDIDEEETDWNSTPTPAPPGSQAKVYSKQPPPSPQRIILHFDLDCFYAQVEMIRNPALRNVPLGIQQKYIIVTCNYVARDLGVTKLMSVTSALEKCPQLVMVKGEDLTYYRETSYKVTELLMSYCPLVERLGFDENFMDITELVERRQRQEAESSNNSFSGHIYNHDGLDADAREHSRLAIGSHIAQELREAIHKKLGLTGCAGIATNKLLAKLVSGTFKPNQQTTLLQESIKDIMSSLSGLRKVPGVGHQTAKRLQALGLVSVQDLQLFPLADLEQEFGSSTAQRLRNLSLGIDDSPVTPTGAPQSLSDEDSFRKMSSAKEVFQKVQDLLSSLLERMHSDGRQPLTFRLTIRRYSATNKWFSRESRQCPIPNHIGQKITSGSSDGLAQLTSMGMKLFNKMVDTTAAFHLTLINVCFSNLQARGAANSKGSITSFFTHKSPDKTQTSSQCQDGLSQSRSSTSMEQGRSNTEGRGAEGMFDEDVSQWIPASPPDLGDQPHWQSAARLSPLTTPQPRTVTSHLCGTVSNQRTDTPQSKQSVKLPLNVDPEVFSLLPEDIQRELLSPANPDRCHKPITQSTLATTVSSGEKNQPASCKFTDKVFRDLEPPRTQINDNLLALPDPQASQVNCSAEEGTSIDQLSVSQLTDSDLPKDIDPEVFSELPPEVQRQLLSEWKQQKPVLKITPTSKKQGKISLAKERKAAAKGSQRNNLLKYFKPS